MDKTYHYLIKILLLGETKVGKTALWKRFCNDEFPTTHNTTIGIDFQYKFTSCEDKKVKMQIWDTASHQKFRSLVSYLYQGTMGIILVYAVDDRSSFESIETWLQQIKNKGIPKVTIALVGNKCDLKDRQVSYEEGKEIAERNGLIFFETSVKEGTYVDEVFHQTWTDIRKTLNKELEEQPPVES